MYQMEQVADGLHFVSEYGIVHGDLKGVSASAPRVRQTLKSKISSTF
jgi:hypothetical protein